MESQIRQGLRVMFDDLFAEKVIISSLYDVAKCLYDMQFKDMLQYPLTDKIILTRKTTIETYIAILVEFIKWRCGAEKMFTALMKMTRFPHNHKDTVELWTKKLQNHVFAIHPICSIELYRERQWLELESQLLSACNQREGDEVLLLHWGRLIYFARQVREQQEAMLYSDHQYSIVGLQLLMFALEAEEEESQFVNISSFPSHLTLNCRGEILQSNHLNLLPTYHIRIPYIILTREQVAEAKDKVEKLLKLFEQILKVVLKEGDEMKDIGDIFLDGILVTASSLYVDINEVSQVYEERSGSEIISLLQVDV